MKTKSDQVLNKKKKKGGPHTCAKCGKKFEKYRIFRWHKITHLEGEQAQTQICNLCGMKFKTQAALQRHIRFHDVEKPFQCEKCGKAYKDKGTLRLHLKTHGDKNAKKGEKTAKFSCKICVKNFKSSLELLSHREIKHKSEKQPYTCHICENSYSDRRGLKNHLSTHKDKSFPCQVCPKNFATLKSFKVHMRLHEDSNMAKPFTCSICNRGFNKKEYLTNHHRVHSGERPFSCEFCNESFAHSSTLSLHRKTCQEKQENEDS